MKKIFGLIGLSLLVLAGVVLVRALLFTSNDSLSTAQVSVDVDEAAVTAHMVEAIKFKTISTGNTKTQDYEPFISFVAWVVSRQSISDR